MVALALRMGWMYPAARAPARPPGGRSPTAGRAWYPGGSQGMAAAVSATVSANCSRTGLSVQGKLSIKAILLDSVTRKKLGEVVVSQPEWEEINLRRSYSYTMDQVEKAR